MSEDTRYVYLMQTETADRYKIGFSKHPIKRAEHITNDSEQENIASVICVFLTDSYHLAESLLHKKYRPYRTWVNREYFDFTDEMLQQVIADFKGIQWMLNNQEFLYLVINKQDRPFVNKESNASKDTVGTSYERRVAIRAGMRRAKRAGKHIGRPMGSTESDIEILDKYPLVVTIIREGVLGLRQTARYTGVSVNTVRKVKTALENQEG